MAKDHFLFPISGGADSLTIQRNGEK